MESFATPHKSIELALQHNKAMSDVKNNNIRPYSIETGLFIFTLMPSLKCSLNCPHCYLSLEQRRDDTIMSLDNLQITANKVVEYYEKRGIENKVVVFYWYGGEPTEMGIDYFTKAVELLNRTFSKEKGFTTKHTVLTSLLTIDENVWFPFFKKYCNGHFQSSFDGLMRGKVYVRKWADKVKKAKAFGLEVGTISVVNNELLQLGPRETLDYLIDLGVSETSFLPFMLNEQNEGKKYDKYAPTMNKWSNFMIELSKYYFERTSKGLPVPEIGQLKFILSQNEVGNAYANLAGQTLFLLPDGQFVLPDYMPGGYKEYMRSFGNILSSSFEEILAGKERVSYMKKQILRDSNKECLECDYAHSCVMEFWKKNRKGDDCFGGKKYVTWLLNEVKQNGFQMHGDIMY